MKIESIPIEQLVEDPANVRTHPDKNLEAIKGSLAKFGQQKPIVVGHDNVVIAGNGTLRAARELGWTQIKIVRTELQGVDRTAFAIADNRTSELAEWDYQGLGGLLRELQKNQVNLEALGWSDYDLEPLLRAEWTPPELEDETDPEDFPEGGGKKEGMAHWIEVTPEERAVFARAVEALRAERGELLKEGEVVAYLSEKFLGERAGGAWDRAGIGGGVQPKEKPPLRGALDESTAGSTTP